MPAGRFCRTRLLIGEKALARLADSTVAVFGLGGVGSYTVEALARAGVGHIRLIDFDEIKYSNINRQLYALETTVGRKKVDVAAERIGQINPGCVVDKRHLFADASSMPDLLALPLDVVVDAIDSLSSKVALLTAAHGLCRPMVTCMGASTRLDPLSVRVGDISESKNCPLARMVRKKLHGRGIFKGIRCVYSVEQADTARVSETAEPENFVRGRPRPSLGSISYMPAMFGLLAAHEVIRIITGEFPAPGV
jgi:tRNA threonylcarbamoyladenosine dehydratase